jgi:hypothetical protein
VAGHAAGEDFTLLDPAALVRLDIAPDALGEQLLVRVAGPEDGGVPATPVTVAGRALRPLAPVHLRLRASAGSVEASWTRRSRTGFGWNDFVDAPLGEDAEAYLVTVTLDGRHVRSTSVTGPAFRYGVADRLADGGGDNVSITVAQLSAAVGPGEATTMTLSLI